MDFTFIYRTFAGGFGLVWFYGISTTVDHLMPNLLYIWNPGLQTIFHGLNIYISNIYFIIIIIII